MRYSSHLSHSHCTYSDHDGRSFPLDQLGMDPISLGIPQTKKNISIPLPEVVRNYNLSGLSLGRHSLPSTPQLVASSGSNQTNSISRRWKREFPKDDIMQVDIYSDKM